MSNISSKAKLPPKNDEYMHSATTPAESTKPELQPFNNKGLQGEKRRISTPSSGISITNFPSPRRIRTEQKARAIIREAPLKGDHMTEALRFVRGAKQPVREARRIVQRALTTKNGMEVPIGAELDLSDAEELKVKLIKRDLGIWPPHSNYLLRIMKDIISGSITKAEFERRSAVLLGMEQPLSKKFRVAEHKYQTTGDWGMGEPDNQGSNADKYLLKRGQ